MEKRAVSHSAPYGHACMSCFKGKCRCIPRRDGNGCERCHRLKKHCVPSNQVRRRTLHPGPELGGRITSRSNSEGDTTAEPQPEVQVSTTLRGLEGVEDTTSPVFGTPDGTSNPTTPESLESSQAACLNAFRSQMLPHFPFFNLSTHTTAQELYLHRPFLLRAISYVASSTTRERHARAPELMRILHEMAFDPHHQTGMLPEAAENTLDLLLGLLTYIAWGRGHTLNSRFIMLAMSLVGEMRPDRSTTSDADTLGLGPSNSKSNAVAHSHGYIMAEHNLDYKRAVLACFMLSAAVSAYAGKIDALRWTPQMDRALAAISNSDSRHDHILVVQIRLQLLAAQGAQIRDHARKTDHNAAETLLIKLEELRSAIEQQQASSLTVHFYHTELAIHEALDATAPLPVAVTSCPPPSARPASNAATAPPPNLTHLWNALLAIKSTTNALLSLSTTSITTTATPTQPPFRGIAFLQWAQLTRCLAALYRFEAPDARWPDGAAREVVDLLMLLDDVVERLEGMAREAGEVVCDHVSDGRPRGGEEGTCMVLVLGLRRFREKVLRERAGVGKPEVVAPGYDGGNGVSVGDLDGEEMVLAPQKGYFRNPRFWLDQIWDRVE